SGRVHRLRRRTVRSGTGPLLARKESQMSSFRSMCLVVLFAGCSAVGCSRFSSGSSSTSGPEPTTAATEEECRAAAAELEQAIRSGDLQRALPAVGLEVLTHRTVAELPVADNLKSELRDVMHSRVNTNMLVEGMVAHVRNGGQFKPLRIRPDDGRH